MGGSSLWVKNGQLSLKKLSYETPGDSTLDDFVYEDTLKNELDRNLYETIENLIIDFPKPAHNLRRTPIEFEKDMCSLYDSAHDFGEWKINYDILSRNSEDESKVFVDRMSFSVLGIENFGLQINDDSTDFYKNYSYLNTASLGGGIMESKITSKDLENLFLFQAMKYSKNNSEGTFRKVNGISFKKINEVLRDEIVDFFNEYKVNKTNGEALSEGSNDTEFIIPVVIDANKKLFKTGDSTLWTNFCYLLTQEGISDPSPKKNPLKKNGLKPFDEERFFYETTNTDNKRTYNLDDISGIIQPSFDVMEDFKVTQTFKVKNTDGDFTITQKEILLNQQNHKNSIEVLRKRYNNKIVKNKSIELNIPEGFNPLEPSSFYDNNTFIKSSVESAEQEISVNRFSDSLDDTMLKKLIHETIEIFTSKRYGDQLQANCVRYINTWNRNGQNGIEFQNLSGNTASFKPERAVLVTHDRMLFAYAIYNKIPVIFDYGKVLMVYKPNIQSDIPAQSMIDSFISSTRGGGMGITLNTKPTYESTRINTAKTIASMIPIKGSIFEIDSKTKQGIGITLNNYKTSLINNYKQSLKEIRQYDFYNFDPHLLFLTYIYGINNLRRQTQSKLNNAIVNILRKIYICSPKYITNDNYTIGIGVLSVSKNVLKYTSDLNDTDPFKKVYLHDIKDIEMIISDKDIKDIGDKIITNLKKITELSFQAPNRRNNLLEIKINDDKTLNTYLLGKESTGLRNDLYVSNCNGILESNITLLKYLYQDGNKPVIYEENGLNSQNNVNSEPVTNAELEEGEEVETEPRRGTRTRRKPDRYTPGSSGAPVANRLFEVLNNYEIKLLTDYETLNTNYLSYYVNENMPETKFYLCDDINIHVFLTNLLRLIEQNKVTNLEFNNIKSCLMEISETETNSNIKENAKELLSSINEIESYLLVLSNKRYPSHSETYNIVLQCVRDLGKQVDSINLKAFDLVEHELLNFVFDNNITQGSFINLINLIESAYQNNLDSVDSAINSNVNQGINVRNQNRITTKKSNAYNSGINSDFNSESNTMSRKAMGIKKLESKRKRKHSKSSKKKQKQKCKYKCREMCKQIVKCKCSVRKPRRKRTVSSKKKGKGKKK